MKTYSAELRRTMIRETEVFLTLNLDRNSTDLEDTLSMSRCSDSIFGISLEEMDALVPLDGAINLGPKPLWCNGPAAQLHAPLICANLSALLGVE